LPGEERLVARIRSTTVLAVRREGTVAMAADGQVTMGNVVSKHGARKLRRLGGGKVVTGFAGSSADAFALLERFEGMLEKHGGHVPRAATELAREWRTDRVLRRLESILCVVDAKTSLLVSGGGDVIEPDDGVLFAGSGGPYAAAAARALLRHTDLGAEAIARAALGIAAELCVYTNDRIEVEVLP
jgi:ATP-dependent HslUV protease subunit HslV